MHVSVFRRFVCLLLAFALLTLPALANETEHWAAEALSWAAENGLLSTDASGSLDPDGTVTGAQAAVILSRLFALSESQPYTGAAGSWYADAAGKALAAGYLPDGLDLTAPLTRAQTWLLLESAFGLQRAQTDEARLSLCADADLLTQDEARAASALLACGVLSGYNGRLDPTGTVTRAQLAVLLQRLMQRGGVQTFSQEATALRDLTDAGELLFAGGTDRVNLYQVTADTITVRCSHLTSLAMDGVCADTLALLQQSGSVRMECGDIKTLVLGGGGGSFSGGTLDSVQLVGSGGSFTFSDSTVGLLIISGSGNTVTLGADVSVQTLAFTAGSSGNVVHAAGQLQTLELDGQTNQVDGAGVVETANLRSAKSVLLLHCGTLNSLVPAEPEPELPEILRLTAAEAAELAKTVSGTYTGQGSGDYDTLTKEAFINSCGYTSQTDYLVWVSRSAQMVNIFTRTEQGLWQLDRSCLCGTGLSGTPEGVTYIFGKQDGWFTSGYTVLYVVNFYPNTGYAFHSRLYYPGTDTISDPAIGYPCSHGCVRMYTEDVQWMWENLPLYTTVVIY